MVFAVRLQVQAKLLQTTNACCKLRVFISNNGCVTQARAPSANKRASVAHNGYVCRKLQQSVRCKVTWSLTSTETTRLQQAVANRRCLLQRKCVCSKVQKKLVCSKLRVFIADNGSNSKHSFTTSGRCRKATLEV